GAWRRNPAPEHRSGAFADEWPRTLRTAAGPAQRPQGPLHVWLYRRRRLARRHAHARRRIYSEAIHRRPAFHADARIARRRPREQALRSWQSMKAAVILLFCPAMAAGVCLNGHPSVRQEYKAARTVLVG